MSTCTLYLITSRQSTRQRAHFAIFVPNSADAKKGTLINVVGAPMVGYSLEIKRNHCPEESAEPYTIVAIGDVSSDHITKSIDGVQSIDCIPRSKIEQAAAQLPPPRISQNFMAPVNDTTNRRCQEWTTDYVRRLVALGYLDKKAVDIVELRRDPPSHGIGLLPGS